MNEEFKPKGFNKWLEWDQKFGVPKEEEETKIKIESPDIQKLTQNKHPSMLSWNTRGNQDYKLKNYNYFTETPEIDINTIHYLKFNKLMSEPPKLNFYMRYQPEIYESELTSKSKSMYSSLMEDVLSTEYLVYDRQYNGMYSKQLDYFHFKEQLMQDLKNQK